MPKKSKQTPDSSKTLLQQLAAMPEKLFSSAFKVQYGALCYREPEGCDIEVLLITSRGTGRWIIPKGWPMNKKKPHEAARIEAFEEAGVIGRVHKKPVGRFTYLKWLETGQVAPCIVEVFQIEVTKTTDRYKEMGQRNLAWVSRDEAARRVREVELKSLIVNFRPNT
ncbi:NUDIX hydrolase [Agrobacterium sp. rho-13.3]|uniref:NUDIX hydrolase n=1 Tax=Agrobacterium sp. rho-13.3 TaxID=3072980 RepID=UPI002A0D761D|nr:NUDIX hydrolase [Agrobacterium sp. rho-13.3]MDX8306789.1 NUDIX hydrolase [Agrobacterium sp. rho-13.3]MDX8306880.1 NUDIX hydrolase [Agrobacterium sp. rho-13.3]